MARRKGRNVSGILLLDKPQGVTSNAALQRAKRLFQARKAGHTGSLDPLATGLLPLCFGEATKVSSFLLGAAKRYLVTARFGVVTDTADAEGEILREQAVSGLNRQTLEEVLERFRGEGDQIPPMYSAVKHQGRRLYELARQGEEVERAARPITIHELRLVELREVEADFAVHCSKGTYVRTLIEDIGEALGVGAHVKALRRTGLGPYDESARLVTMEEIESAAEDGFGALDALLLPMETALTQWPGVHLSDDVAFYLRQGQPVWVPKAPPEGWVRLYAGEGRFLGMGAIMGDGRIAPKRLLASRGS
jgi:tRNA pseudouridine55 synthase